MIPEELQNDIEHVVNGQWYLILAKGHKLGNQKKGFRPVALMEEEEFKELVRKIITSGIEAGIDYANTHKTDETNH